jgi:hypothetical protein
MSPRRRQPTPEDIDRIAAVSDPVIRNLQITQAYCDLSAVTAARLGPVANWCTYATWASKQAGRTIREEDIWRALQAALGASAGARQAASDVATEARGFGAVVPTVMPLAIGSLAVRPALARSSDAVARGNVKVFEEIGREFARFEVVCGADTVTDTPALAAFLEGLRPGEPPDGQRYLRQAFTRYHRARFEPDPVAQAQLVLLANLEIGFHEQTRLQPEIAEALDAAAVDPRDVRDRLIKALFPHLAWIVRFRLWIARVTGRRSLLDVALDALVLEEQRIARLVLTRFLMSIDLSTAAHLQLGDDLPATIPPSLQEIVLPDLQELLGRIDPTPDTEQGSGAVDWADLADRIHFIAQMFRCYQESSFVFDAPFSPAQVERIDAGERPADPL